MYELFIEGFKVDIDQKLSVQLTFAIDDIANFSSRETGFSKTIILPGTGRNNQIFGFIYDIASFNYELPGGANIGAVFNAAQTSRAELRLNGLLVLRGVFRITNIIKDKDVIEYEGALFGELSGFISQINNKKLEDLDFSLYNHNYTQQKIVNSWDNKITKSVNGIFSTINDVIFIDSFYDLSDINVGDEIIVEGASISNNNDTYIVESITLASNAYQIGVNKNLTNSLGDSFTITYSIGAGKGYYYPLIDYGTYSSDKIDYDIKTFRPALYVKEYIDKIFEDSGYRYESSFFESSFFKALIVPNNTKELKTMANESLKLSTSSAAGIVDNLLYFDINDFLGDFTTSDGKTFTYNGSSTFRPIVSLTIKNFSLDTFENIQFDLKIVLKVTNGAVVSRFGFNGNNNLTSYDYVVPEERLNTSRTQVSFSGSVISFGGTGLLDFQPKIGTTITVSNTSNNNGSFTVTNVDLSGRTITVSQTLNAASTISASFNYAPNSRTSSSINLTDYIKEDQLFDTNIVNGTQIAVEVYFGQSSANIFARSFLDVVSEVPVLTTASENDFLILNDTIPKNITQKDFFTWIVKMFNLYIYEDKLDEKLLNVVPYKDFLSDEQIDWTFKIARDKPWQIKPMGLLNSRFFEYKYKEDNDFYNEGYKKKYNLPYGSNLQDTQFEFAKDKQTVEIGFSPTVLVQYETTDKVLPAIYKKSKGNAVDQEELTDSNIRILLTKKIDGVDGWYIQNQGDNLGSQLTSYGYAGHFDDPLDPTKDINFGANSEIYFDPNVYPSANLYNEYWSGYIAEIVEKDSKLLSCHARLTPLDIAQLDFSKPVIIDSVLFRLNKVEDYDYKNDELVKVELLKVINPINPILLCANNWTKENYKGTTYRNGGSITQATSSAQWAELNKMGAGAWCYYNFDSANDAQYGKLYNWYALNNINGFAPLGYRVPTIADWEALIECLGGSDVAGGKMKTIDIWDSPNTDATNISGFNGVPSGGATLPVDPPIVLNFSEPNRYAYYWASDNLGDPFAQIYILRYDEGTIQDFLTKRDFAFSVRLIKE